MAPPPPPADDTNNPPKLIIDSDWKSQAQAEKEKLAAKEAEKAKTAPAPASAAGGPQQGMQQLPKADWQALLGTMVSQTLMYMGAYPDPETGRAVVSLEYAKFHIDMLEVLHTKTKGNLTQQEETDFTQVLSELRMRYVELSQFVAQKYAEQLAKGGGAAGAGGQQFPGITPLAQ